MTSTPEPFNVTGNTNQNDTNGSGSDSFELAEVPYVCAVDIIAGLGVVGNILMLILMSSRNRRGYSYAIYLLFLAVSDSGVLIMTASEDTMDHIYHTLNSFLTQNRGTCKIWSFVLEIVSVESPWLLAALTFDRYITVVFPTKREKLCTRKIAIGVSGSIVFLSILLSIPVAVGMDHLAEDEGLTCDISRLEFNRYGIFLGVFMSAVVPVLVIIFLNTRTLITVRRGHFYAGSEAEVNKFKITLSLIVVSVTSTIALIPYAVTVLVEYLLTLTDDPENPSYALELASFVWYIFNVVRLLNFAMNFYVLIAFSSQWRHFFVQRFKPLLPSNKDEMEMDSDTERTSATRF